MLVETAITVPLFFLLIFGIIEFGFIFRDYVALTATANDAVRAATISGNDYSADHHILEVLLESSSPIPDGAIKTVIVFKADGPSGEVPPLCLSGSQNLPTVKCNSYEWSDLGLPITEFGCNPIKDLDEYWCPADRGVSQSDAEFIGVHVVLERNLLTGIFGDTKQLTATEVLRIEPQEL